MRFHSLRYKLVLVLLVVLIAPMSGICLITLNRIRQQSRELLKARLTGAIDRVRVRVRDVIDEGCLRVNLVCDALRVHLTAHDPKALQKEMIRAAVLLSAESLYLVDASGKILCHVGKGEGNLPAGLTKRVLASEATTVDVFPGDGLNLVFTAPIYLFGEKAASMVAFRTIGAEFADELKSRTGMEITLSDHGRLLLTSAMTAQGERSSAFLPDAKIVAKTSDEVQPQVQIELVEVGGVPYGQATGWVYTRDRRRLCLATVSAPSSELAATSHTERLVLLITLCSIFLAVAVGFFLARSITTPVSKLAGTAIEVSRGNLDTEVDIHSTDEIGDLARSFRKMIAGLKERDRIRAEKQKIEEKLQIAREIQQGLLPSETPDVPGYEIVGWNKTCDETGGDYYDYLLLDDHRLVLLIADVAGHGIGPALVMSEARALLRATLKTGADLSRTAEIVNFFLVNDLPPDIFVTAFIAMIDLDSGAIDYISAGHEPALVYRSNSQQVEELPSTGLPLGLADGITYEHAQASALNNGDVLLITTDGIRECSSPSGEEFGLDRAKEILVHNSSIGADRVVEQLTKAVFAFRGDLPQQDDITLIVLRRLATEDAEDFVVFEEVDEEDS